MCTERIPERTDAAATGAREEQRRDGAEHGSLFEAGMLTWYEASPQQSEHAPLKIAKIR